MNVKSLAERIDHLHKLIDGYRQENKKVKAENKTLKLRNQSLESFVEKGRGGFKILYHYHHGGGIDNNGEHVESVTDTFIIAQCIPSYQDAEHLLRFYESYNNLEHVSFIITSPAEGNDDDLPF